jgi:hypothetical protein
MTICFVCSFSFNNHSFLRHSVNQCLAHAIFLKSIEDHAYGWGPSTALADKYQVHSHAGSVENAGMLTCAEQLLYDMLIFETDSFAYFVTGKVLPTSVYCFINTHVLDSHVSRYFFMVSRKRNPYC